MQPFFRAGVTEFAGSWALKLTGCTIADSVTRKLMSTPTEQSDVSQTLATVLNALLTQIEMGMSFEHARGVFRDVAMQFGFSPTAAEVKNATYSLYLGWRAHRLKKIDNLVEQGYLPLSSPDPDSSLVWEDDLLPKSRLSVDDTL
jgi:hypothetical protein